MASRRYVIIFKPVAERAMKAIKDRAVLRRISAAIVGLETNPRPPDMKALQGTEPLFRIRVGDYRIVYSIVDRVLTVTIVMIGHRRDVYRVLTRR